MSMEKIRLDLHETCSSSLEPNLLIVIEAGGLVLTLLIHWLKKQLSTGSLGMFPRKPNNCKYGVEWDVSQKERTKERKIELGKQQRTTHTNINLPKRIDSSDELCRNSKGSPNETRNEFLSNRGKRYERINRRNWPFKDFEVARQSESVQLIGRPTALRSATTAWRVFESSLDVKWFSFKCVGIRVMSRFIGMRSWPAQILSVNCKTKWNNWCCGGVNGTVLAGRSAAETISLEKQIPHVFFGY